MIPDRESLRAGSTVLGIIETVRTNAPKWAEHASTVRAVRALFAPPPQADERDDGSDALGTETAVTETAAPSTSDVTEPTGASDPENPVWTASLLYRGMRACRRFVQSAWLYRWLTSEPEPETIVIDLRETLSVGPILARIDRTLRDAIDVIPTSGWIRLAYRLRQRFLDRPVRITSGGLVVVVLVGLLGQTVSGTDLGLDIIVLLAVLFAAARGTQSTLSWAELTATPWVELLHAAFSPPEPPEPARPDTATAAETSPNSAEQSVDVPPDSRDDPDG